MVWKADNVNVENLTACNFLGGTGGDGGTGNEIWWNGGAGSGKVGGWGYLGRVPERDEHLLSADTHHGAQREASGRVRDLLEQLGRRHVARTRTRAT